MTTHKATPTKSNLRTGGQILVDELRLNGVDQVFCVPGESYLAALDALHDSDITTTVCRQEGGAAMMAEAAGKLTGRPGICFVTRGPGATNASAAVHIAMQDSTPMILFVGQIGREMREREAFQELDYRAVFGTMAKWATEINTAERIPEIISRAFNVACSGRPGPVVIALPEDMLTDLASVGSSKSFKLFESAPSTEDLDDVVKLLASSRQPIIIAGGSRWDETSFQQLDKFARDFDVPIAVSFRRQALISADHPNYVGDLGPGANPALVSYIKNADLVILLGGRLSEMPSQGYTLLSVPFPKQTFVHIHPGSDEIGRVYRPDIAFNVSPASFMASLSKLPRPTSSHSQRSGGCENLRRSFEDWTVQPARTIGNFDLAAALFALRSELPDDAIICNGAGNYSVWVHRFFRFRSFASQLAPTSGSMGYGVPAAVGAKRIFPKKAVVAFAGDGCFLMHGQEFATAVQYGLPIVVIVVDNGMYGTIRMHQEREYPSRVIATELRNPDFAAYARAFGGHGETVTETEDFLGAYKRSVNSGLPSIIHCLVDPEALTPNASLTEIRDNALRNKH